MSYDPGGVDLDIVGGEDAPALISVQWRPTSDSPFETITNPAMQIRFGDRPGGLLASFAASGGDGQIVGAGATAVTFSMTAAQTAALASAAYVAVRRRSASSPLVVDYDIYGVVVSTRRRLAHGQVRIHMNITEAF